jgi:hypothetical protein
MVDLNAKINAFGVGARPVGRICATALPKVSSWRFYGKRIHSRRSEVIVLGLNLDFARQLPLGAHAEQVADEQRLEHKSRMARRTSIVGAVGPGDAMIVEGKVDHRVDLAKQVILGDKPFERHNLESCLLKSGFPNMSQ